MRVSLTGLVVCEVKLSEGSERAAAIVLVAVEVVVCADPPAALPPCAFCPCFVPFLCSCKAFARDFS